MRSPGDGGYVRTATVTYDGTTTWVVSGVRDYVVLKTTDSEFRGFLKDKYTTLKPTDDRVDGHLGDGQWRHTDRRHRLGQVLRQRVVHA